MIKLTIKDKEFTLCSSWDEITFGQYIDLVNITQDTNTNLERTAKYIAAVSNDFEPCLGALYSLTPEDFTGLQEHFSFLNQDKDQFKDYPIAETLSVDGRTFKFKNNYNGLTLGEMVNVETILTNYPNLSQFEVGFGILIRELNPDGTEKEFTEELFVDTLTTLKDKVMLSQVYSLLSFFLPGDNEHTNNSRGFSVEPM